MRVVRLRLGNGSVIMSSSESSVLECGQVGLSRCGALVVFEGSSSRVLARGRGGWRVYICSHDGIC